MHSLVDKVIVPYFKQKKVDLGIKDPEEQKLIRKIDCWSGYKLREFLAWMKEKHLNIIVPFVPGNCTGVFQPLDVGIQRVLKQSLQQSCHQNMVAELTRQMENNPDRPLEVDVRVGTL
jgi:hypothetical protein